MNTNVNGSYFMIPVDANAPLPDELLQAQDFLARSNPKTACRETLQRHLQALGLLIARLPNIGTAALSWLKEALKTQEQLQRLDRMC